MKQTNYMPESQLTRASFQPRNNSTNTWPSSSSSLPQAAAGHRETVDPGNALPLWFRTRTAPNTWPPCCTDCIPCCTDRKLHTVSLWPNRRMM